MKKILVSLLLGLNMLTLSVGPAPGVAEPLSPREKARRVLVIAAMTTAIAGWEYCFFSMNPTGIDPQKFAATKLLIGAAGLGTWLLFCDTIVNQR